MPSFFHHTARGSSLADVNFTGEGLSGLSALFLLLYFCPESWNSIASPQFGEFKRSSFWLLQHHVSCFVFVKVFKVLEGLGTWVFSPQLCSFSEGVYWQAWSFFPFFRCPWHWRGPLCCSAFPSGSTVCTMLFVFVQFLEVVNALVRSYIQPSSCLELDSWRSWTPLHWEGVACGRLSEKQNSSKKELLRTSRLMSNLALLPA